MCKLSELISLKVYNSFLYVGNIFAIRVECFFYFQFVTVTIGKIAIDKFYMVKLGGDKYRVTKINVLNCPVLKFRKRKVAVC